MSEPKLTLDLFGAGNGPNVSSVRDFFKLLPLDLDCSSVSDGLGRLLDDDRGAANRSDATRLGGMGGSSGTIEGGRNVANVAQMRSCRKHCANYNIILTFLTLAKILCILHKFKHLSSRIS